MCFPADSTEPFHALLYSPHYRLAEATTALKAGLTAEGYDHLYKEVETKDFTQEIVRQFNDNWFFINEDQVVRDHHKEQS